MGVIGYVREDFICWFIIELGGYVMYQFELLIWRKYNQVVKNSKKSTKKTFKKYSKVQQDKELAHVM